MTHLKKEKQKTHRQEIKQTTEPNRDYPDVGTNQTCYNMIHKYVKKGKGKD